MGVKHHLFVMFASYAAQMHRYLILAGCKNSDFLNKMQIFSKEIVYIYNFLLNFLHFCSKTTYFFSVF